MWRPEAVVQTLAARGELWEAAPGLVGMRGEVLALYRALEQAIARLSATETADDWQVPPGIDLATLARAGYFASFPQWLTAVAKRSEEHTSELQSRFDLVCRLLLEKKKK